MIYSNTLETVKQPFISISIYHENNTLLHTLMPPIGSLQSPYHDIYSDFEKRCSSVISFIVHIPLFTLSPAHLDLQIAVLLTQKETLAT